MWRLAPNGAPFVGMLKDLGNAFYVIDTPWVVAGVVMDVIPLYSNKQSRESIQEVDNEQIIEYTCRSNVLEAVLFEFALARFPGHDLIRFGAIRRYRNSTRLAVTIGCDFTRFCAIWRNSARPHVIRRDSARFVATWRDSIRFGATRYVSA